MKNSSFTPSVAILLGALALTASAAQQHSLQAGAARVDISPATSVPMAGFPQREKDSQGVHDKIYVRAIVLSDGAAQAAIIAWELSSVPDRVWTRLSKRITAEAGIPETNILLAAVHNHSGPTLDGAYVNMSTKSADYTRMVEDACVRAVQQAKARLQPARFGTGTGKAYLNINRRELTPDRGWWVGYNPDGPSDKTVAVLKFETLTGKPIALLINYAVHAVVMGPENMEISGDLPGATSRFVEQYFSGAANYAPRFDSGYQLKSRPTGADVNDGFVAVWTSGAAGDQNTISVPKEADFTLVNAMGRILGEEAIRVATTIHTTPQAQIRGAQDAITCPGRVLEPGPRPRKEYKFNDSVPVNIRLSLLAINDVALTGVSGEVFTMIHQRLRSRSPLNHTFMITHANGGSGYIPDDSSFDQVSYEIAVSRLKPGCAEKSIVDGLLDMIARR